MLPHSLRLAVVGLIGVVLGSDAAAAQIGQSGVERL